MSKAHDLTFSVSEEVQQKLAQLAAQMDQTPSAVAGRALEAYVDHQLWMLEEIEQGREDFRQGRTMPHDEVMQQADAILARYKSDAA